MWLAFTLLRSVAFPTSYLMHHNKQLNIYFCHTQGGKQNVFTVMVNPQTSASDVFQDNSSLVELMISLGYLPPDIGTVCA